MFKIMGRALKFGTSRYNSLAVYGTVGVYGRAPVGIQYIYRRRAAARARARSRCAAAAAPERAARGRAWSHAHPYSTTVPLLYIREVVAKVSRELVPATGL